MLVIASATAMRAEAAASSSATGVRSPIAIASPVVTSKLVAVTAHVGDRHLPAARPSGRARPCPPTRAVADRDQERLVGDRRAAASTRSDRLGEIDRRRRRTARRARATRDASRVHARRLAEQHLERHVDRACRRSARRRPRSLPSSVASPSTANGQRSRAAAPRTPSSPSAAMREHVALLRLVAPDLERRHAGLVVRDCAQLEARAARRCRARARAARSTGRRRRRRGSRGSGCSSPSAQQRSITSWQRRSISALSRCTRGEVEVLAATRPPPATTPRRRRGRSASPDRRARRCAAPAGISPFCTCSRADVAEAAGEHDRLVVAAHLGAAGAVDLAARRCGSSRRGSGRPNSLLNAAPPSGPSIMMSSAVAMRVGLAVVRSPTAARRECAGSRRVKPTSPALGFAPRPVAPSSRISPPEPVAAPGNGEIAVGWLCVSTFIRMCTGSRARAYTPSSGSGKKRPPRVPSMTAALSL